jgi:hypothetical protein
MCRSCAPPVEKTLAADHRVASIKYLPGTLDNKRWTFATRDTVDTTAAVDYVDRAFASNLNTRLLVPSVRRGLVLAVGDSVFELSTTT